ncbi:MAG: PAS domain-containing protein [Proteobacteria bacterium]|uniref:PAS domain-containing protein n=1 Tax=Candidatus Avisuccinivibrio stercorigallinarum TaxID=2840704 RepID=A0A9D9D9Z3_9GAMM|nr:PAS domain-containing protein [Candidatus Avisuccinivibrio stercorigallinarum]
MNTLEAYHLTEADHQILDGYKHIVESIGLIFGSSCEVVLHSLADLSHSVIAIHNGAKTGRQVGSPVTDKALSVLQDCERSNRPNSGLYHTTNADGHAMRSVTTVIRGVMGHPIGLLCINFDISTPFNELAATLLTPAVKKAGAASDEGEHFALNIDDLFANKVRKVQDAVIKDKSVPARCRTHEIIVRLNNEGLFKLRKAVPRISEILNISRDAIYMHLRNEQKNNGR